MSIYGPASYFALQICIEAVMTTFRLKVGNPFNSFFNEVIQTLIILLTPTSCSDLHLLAKAAINIVGVKKKKGWELILPIF